jgi:hypothetical protein
MFKSLSLTRVHIDHSKKQHLNHYRALKFKTLPYPQPSPAYSLDRFITYVSAHAYFFFNSHNNPARWVWWLTLQINLTTSQDTQALGGILPGCISEGASNWTSRIGLQFGPPPLYGRHDYNKAEWEGLLPASGEKAFIDLFLPLESIWKNQLLELKPAGLWNRTQTIRKLSWLLSLQTQAGTTLSISGSPAWANSL